jgi:hypothetical protein
VADLLSALAAFASTLWIQTRGWLQRLMADTAFPPAAS